MDSIITPTELTPATFVAVVATVCVLTGGVICGRLSANLHHCGKLFLEDCMCLCFYSLTLNYTDDYHIRSMSRGTAVSDMEFCYLLGADSW